MGRSLLKGVFDINILIELLNGHEEANNEIGRYSWLAIRGSVGSKCSAALEIAETQKRVKNLLRYFDISFQFCRTGRVD